MNTLISFGKEDNCLNSKGTQSLLQNETELSDLKQLISTYNCSREQHVLNERIDYECNLLIEFIP